MTKKGKIVAVSGGFDPVHIGHVRMFEAAKELVGSEGTLVIILNCDAWLQRKKERVFMPQEERAEVIRAFRVVDEVYIHESEDNHVCGALVALRPNIFANGGDRKLDNIPEVAACEELNIEMVFNVGTGGKVQSSSWLLDKYHPETKSA